MGQFGLEDEAGHSLTANQPQGQNGVASYGRYLCSCGEEIWASSKVNGKADSRTVQRWRDHIEINVAPADFEVLVGTVKKVRTTHTVRVFLTTHPDFGSYETTGRRAYWYANKKNLRLWCVAIEKSGNYKNQIYAMTESRESAIATARQYIRREDNNFQTDLSLKDGVQIEVVSKSLLDATTGLLNEADAALAEGDLDGLLMARTQIKEVLSMDALLRQKMIELEAKIPEVMGVSA